MESVLIEALSEKVRRLCRKWTTRDVEFKKVLQPFMLKICHHVIWGHFKIQQCLKKSHWFSVNIFFWGDPISLESGQYWLLYDNVQAWKKRPSVVVRWILKPKWLNDKIAAQEEGAYSFRLTHCIIVLLFLHGLPALPCLNS